MPTCQFAFVALLQRLPAFLSLCMPLTLCQSCYRGQAYSLLLFFSEGMQYEYLYKVSFWHDCPITPVNVIIDLLQKVALESVVLERARIEWS